MSAMSSAIAALRRRAILLTVLLLAACSDATAPPADGPIDVADAWLRANPADVNMDAALLADASARASNISRFRSLLVARHGRLVLERYYGGATVNTLHDVRSVTKSVVSLLTGIAHAEGFVPNLDASIGDFLDADYVLDDSDRQVTVRNLLTMSSGYQWNESGTTEYNLWVTAPEHVQYLLDRPHQWPPGQHFTYNSAAVHVLGVILEHATGMSLPAFAQQYLFGPAGITNVQWEQLDGGHVNGAAGIQLRARDLLRLGQLVLQGGLSGSRQIVPADWILTAGTPAYTWRSELGDQAGVSYGYLWWTTDSPRGLFGWGYGGQYLYVVPERDLVVLVTADWHDLGPADVDAMYETMFNVIADDIVPAAR
jgi:CubicO group peptidase (beta-lactamase class C family)